MVWCIEHADSGDEVIECLAESLSILEVSISVSVAILRKKANQTPLDFSCILTPLIASDPSR